MLLAAGWARPDELAADHRRLIMIIVRGVVGEDTLLPAGMRKLLRRCAVGICNAPIL